MRDTSLSLWRISQKRAASFDEISENGYREPVDDCGWERVVDMELNVHTNLVASAISDNGLWLAVSDLYEAKLFKIESHVSRTAIYLTFFIV
jgi:U3 small nucleolar RNA-associated protein 4